MSLKRTFTIILVASAVMLAAGFGPRVINSARALPLAQANVTVPYSGSLTNDAGQPVADGTYEFTFRLYTFESGGEALWTESQAGVTVQAGGFAVLLGGLNPLLKAALDGGARWLEVGVRGPGETGFTLLSPRQELRAAASAATAGKAAPEALSCAHTHWGEYWSGSGIGLHLISSNDTPLWAETSGGWAGVDGRNTTGFGVYGRSTSGVGVVGKTTATTGTTTGVWGEVASAGGSTSTYARGVVGYATDTTGNNFGMWGQSDSHNGTGVYGRADNGSCSGGPFGTCAGVSAHSSKGNAVYAQTDSSIAVFADATGNGEGLVLYSQGSGDFIDAYWLIGGNLKFKVDTNGNVSADGTFTPGGADLAEMLPAVTGLEPGDVLVVGEDGQLARCTAANQPTVVGVYSTRPGFVGGAGDGADLTGKIPLAVTGVVPVKASAENGAIHPGDLLVASATPGHAMKAGSDPAVGTVIGKALGVLENGTGVIQMLVMLQ
jgi:hypothetical protein